MNPVTIVVLTCACAVYAQDSPMRASSSFDWSPAGPMMMDIPQQSPVSAWFDNLRNQNQQYPIRKEDYSYLPVNQDLVNNSPQWPSPFSMDQTSPNLEEDYSMKSPAEDKGIPSLQNAQKPWTPPPYRQSMMDFNEAIANVKSHFTPLAFTDKVDKNFRYIVVIHTVDQLSKVVAEKGWDYYNRNYTNIIKDSIHTAVMNPRGVVAEIMCVIVNPINVQLEKMKKIMFNPYVAFVCYMMPTACDAIIYSVLNWSPHYLPQPEAALLLTVGDASSTFLKSYAGAFDAISTQNAYLYLLNGAENLQKLVGKNAEVRKMLYPRGSRPCPK